ncbi:putrescine ABC transport system, permease [Caballeronia sordidicola]|uniref:Putrescine ABC transport system, permease n=1 Tax=Caballeronia sordidicola TaxID=196367 RepID=A0A158EP79_CABSO|nr:ABC transporter permease [Caballeronia sordidicola]SAL08889.1 putrescine ABC transport system, permease [Caballeronia sordidicola]
MSDASIGIARRGTMRTPLERSPWLLPLFLSVWLTLVIAPLLVLFAYSFFESRNFAMIYKPSLATWESLFTSGRFEVTVRTLRIALTVTVIELALAFPSALWLAKGGCSKTTKALVLALLTIPFFLDLSSRIIVWRGILDENGLINHVLMALHVIASPIRGMLYTEQAVHFGMIVSYFPMMVLPIYMAISVIDDTLIAAAADLGASPWRVLADIILPLSMPGILAGVVFTLGPALASWIEPNMLGGGFVNLLSNSVDSAYSALRYPVVAALSSFVILMVGLMLAVLMFLTRRFADLSTSFRNLQS